MRNRVVSNHVWQNLISKWRSKESKSYPINAYVQYLELDMCNQWLCSHKISLHVLIIWYIEMINNAQSFHNSG